MEYFYCIDVAPFISDSAVASMTRAEVEAERARLDLERAEKEAKSAEVEAKRLADLEDDVNQIIKVDVDTKVEDGINSGNCLYLLYFDKMLIFYMSCFHHHRSDPEEVPLYMREGERIDDELEDHMQLGPLKRANAPFQVLVFIVS